MITTTNIGIVLVTAPDITVARNLARAALEARLVACANLVPKLESHYWWQDNLESSEEVLIIFKATQSRLSELEKLILEKHPYDTPEIIYLPVTASTEKYLNWWKAAAGGRS